MSLSPGTRLGPYEILSALGAGGMGEVYRARDSKLNRDVAVKVLPEAFAEDHDRVARFRREAQVVASLNHPNIAAIYGLEETGGAIALALELVEGDDLAERLDAGPMPVDEAISIARQIAEGLEAAHERGIVHRDLKPANIKLTRDGTVKILDFGLAKAWSADGETSSSSGPGLSQSPTMSRNMTQAGMILGTAAYMSPEQARGRAVDKRSDIWSFGVVLYEMLTGTRLFHGETVSDTLAAVLRQEVDLAAVPTSTPSTVRRLLARCLERDPKLRLRDVGEARLILAEPGFDPSSATPAPAARESAASGRALWLSALALVALFSAAIGVWSWTRLHPVKVPVVSRFSIVLPPGQVLTGGGPTISRDGRAIAYVARDASGVSRLYVRALDRFDATVVPGSESAQQPFFSPDGGRVGFYAGAKLMTAAIAGGAPTAIADASFLPLGGTWSEDDTIVFSPTLNSGLLRVPASGGKVEVLADPDVTAGFYAYSFPQFLPGGRYLLFTIWGGINAQGRGPALLSLATKKWTHVLAGIQSCRYATSGHLLVSNPHGIQAAPFDPDHPSATNALTFVVDDVYSTTSTSSSWFAVSDNGTLAYVPGDPNLGTLTWIDREGRATPVSGRSESFENLVLSPDGTRAVVGNNEGALWVVDLKRGTKIRLTLDGDGSNAYPVWSGDGTRIFFGSNRGGDWDIYAVAAGGGPATRVLARKDNQFPLSLAPDGTLLYNERSKEVTSGLWMLAPDGTVTPYLVSPGSKVGAKFSPDGSLVAYVSDETGREEVYVRSVAKREDVVTVSPDGGGAPMWSPDGRELFYRRGDAFMTVGITASGSISVGEPKKLFETYAARGRTSNHPGYSVSPDGRRFLVQLLDPRALPTQINVVENWFEELNAKVPRR